MLLAVITTDLLGGSVPGAVYRPVGVMKPNVALPPGMSFTDQVTSELLESSRESLNWRVLLTRTIASDRLIDPDLRF